VSSTVKIEKNDEYKGISYTLNYMTLPGLPVVCMFMKAQNDAGLYKRLNLNASVFLSSPSGSLRDMLLSGVTAGGTEYRRRPGSNDYWRDLGRLASAEFTPDSEADIFYMYFASANREPVELSVDRNTAMFNASWSAETENGKSFTSRPVFIILTPEKMTEDMLSDLDGMVFA
jgi:hypothetical protein